MCYRNCPSHAVIRTTSRCFSRALVLKREGGALTSRKPAQSGFRVVITALFLLAALIAVAQPGSGLGLRGRGGQPRNPQWRQKRIQRDRHRHPPNFFRRLRNLPPDQQDRILRNDAQFHDLPAARQAQIRRNLSRWNSLTPRQKRVIRQREEIVRSLSPAQRQDLRTVFPQYRQLKPQEQRQVMRAFRRLRDMPPQKRSRFLNSPRFEQRFTPKQQQVLRGLNQLLPQG